MALLLCRVTHQTCDFNKFLLNFREIRPEKLIKKLPKNHTKNDFLKKPR